MKYVEVSRRVNASPQIVWGILCDPKRLVQEPLGLISLDGVIEPGGQLQLRSQVSPKQVFKLHVTTFEAAQKMTWKGGMPLGLFTGQRTFTLKATPDGSTDIHIREEFTGLMSGLIWKSMPDLLPSFDTFADGLKNAAERDAA